MIELEEISMITAPKNSNWENGKLTQAAEVIHLRQVILCLLRLIVQANMRLQEKVEYLMQKERDLMEIINKMQYQHRKNVYQMA